MSNVKDFLKRKDIVIPPQRYLIEALGAMAQGLFASLLIGTIIKTLGQQAGLDVSKYQKNVDWAKIKKAGVSFVIVRIGYRGYGEAGTLVLDPMFEEHFTNVKNAGLKGGGYFFS